MAGGSTYVNSFTNSVIDSAIADYAALALTTNTILAWSAYLPPGSGYFTVARNLDVTPATGGLTLTLPAGTQASVGADILITNRGATAFVVQFFNSTTQATVINPGQAVYFVLTNNTTDQGVWRTTNFGASTSGADANALAGAGLSANNGLINENFNVIQFNSATTVWSDANRANAYVWTGGAGSSSLVAGLSAGWFIWFRNGGTGTYTFFPPSGTFINGLTSLPVQISTSVVIAFDRNSGNFFTFATQALQNFSFTSTTTDTSAVLVNTLSLTNGAAIIQRYIDIAQTRTQNLLIVLPATASLYAVINNTGSNAYNIQFQVAGSSQTPVIVPNGMQFFLSTDGVNLYVLASSSAGSLQLNDGTAGAPALYYTNEVTTGLYRAGPYQFGIAVGGAPAVILNGADQTNRQFFFNGTGIFNAIDGGLI